MHIQRKAITYSAVSFLRHRFTIAVHMGVREQRLLVPCQILSCFVNITLLHSVTCEKTAEPIQIREREFERGLLCKDQS